MVHYKKITAEHNLFDLKLKEVWKYRDLIMLFTQRSFTVQYKQTILGPAWLFLTPIISSLIYCFIFGGLAGMSTDGIPQILFYMSGNAIWGFFSNCLNGNANTFRANANMFGKVYFPRLTVPISNIISAAIRFFIQMIMTVAFLAFYTVRGEAAPNWWSILVIPVILVELGLMGMGLGIIVSSFTTKYRDLAVLVGFGMQLWMYITPVIYPLSQAGDKWYKWVLLINPVSAPVELFRMALLGNGSIQPLYLVWSACFTLIVTVLGIMVFNKVEKNFMDTV